MPLSRVDDYRFREFRVVVAEGAGNFVAIGYGPRGELLFRAEGETREDAEIEVKSELLKRSGDFVGIDEAMKLFLRAYPDGFADAYFDFDERRYKMAARQKTLELLGRDRLDKLIADGAYVEIANVAKRTFTNLIFPNEAMKFGDFVKSTSAPHRRFSEALRETLWGDDFDAGFDEIVRVLKPHGAAKWTILTYWPFLAHPEEHMFLKPEVAAECAWRLGEDFGYESEPSAAVYRRYLSFAENVRLGIAELAPRDFIDVQTFMYAVGKPGFVAGTEERRLHWLKAQA